MKNPDRKCNIAYMYCAFCNSEHSKVQNNLYLLCVSQSGEFKSAKQLMFTVIFAIRSTRKCKITYIYCVFCNQENSRVQNTLYLLCFFQFGELKYAKQLIFTVLFAIMGPSAPRGPQTWHRPPEPNQSKNRSLGGRLASILIL